MRTRPPVGTLIAAGLACLTIGLLACPRARVERPADDELDEPSTDGDDDDSPAGVDDSGVDTGDDDDAVPDDDTTDDDDASDDDDSGCEPNEILSPHPDSGEPVCAPIPGTTGPGVITCIHHHPDWDNCAAYGDAWRLLDLPAGTTVEAWVDNVDPSTAFPPGLVVMADDVPAFEIDLAWDYGYNNHPCTVSPPYGSCARVFTDQAEDDMTVLVWMEGPYTAACAGEYTLSVEVDGHPVDPGFGYDDAGLNGMAGPGCPNLEP